jgi:hypothetical protein
MTLVVTSMLAFVIIALVIAGMSIGVMAGRKPIKGSCGGLNGGGCELCSGDRCRKTRET